MKTNDLWSFSKGNQHLILLLLAGHLLWGIGVFALFALGADRETAVRLAPWGSGFFIVLQLYVAAQLLLPALLLRPEERSRLFYLFWGLTLALTVFLLHLPPVNGLWRQLLLSLQSAVQLLAATLTGAVLARHVRRLWEIVPICIVISLADVGSFFGGPTGEMIDPIRKYIENPVGPPPTIFMFLIKTAQPGVGALLPLCGVTDWIMVAFFAVVARYHGVNDNLAGPPGEALAQQGRIGCYIPVSFVALLAAVLLVQATGLFLPALPVIAIVMLLWYGARHLLLRHQVFSDGGSV